MSEAPGRVAMWPPPSEGFEGSFAKFTCRFVRSCHALVNLSRAKSKIFVVPAGGEPKRLHLRFPNLVKLDSALRIGEGVIEVPNRDDDARDWSTERQHKNEDTNLRPVGSPFVNSSRACLRRYSSTSSCPISRARVHATRRELLFAEVLRTVLYKSM